MKPTTLRYLAVLAVLVGIFFGVRSFGRSEQVDPDIGFLVPTVVSPSVQLVNGQTCFLSSQIWEMRRSP